MDVIKRAPIADTDDDDEFMDLRLATPNSFANKHPTPLSSDIGEPDPEPAILPLSAQEPHAANKPTNQKHSKPDKPKKSKNKNKSNKIPKVNVDPPADEEKPKKKNKKKKESIPNEESANNNSEDAPKEKKRRFKGFPWRTPNQSSTTINTDIDPGVYISSDNLVNRSWSEKQFVTSPEEEETGWGEDENKERGNWSGKLDFLLSCLGYAVGLGNVWRFPYLCYRNGGGAFFIPYVIMLTFVGMPLFFMELSLGQFSSNGPLTCWEFCPIFQGVGVAMVIVSGLVGIYYNMIIAWSLFYLFASLNSEVPWKTCNGWWNTRDCSLLLPQVSCVSPLGSRVEYMPYPNGTCYTVDPSDSNATFIGIWSDTLFQKETNRKRIFPSEEYYNNFVLGLSSGIGETGFPRWQLVLSLLGAWVIVFCCMIKGIKSTGKVVYFTALFPYAVLIILLGRGASLPGAAEGIKFYLTPQWEKLLSAKVWYDAAVQIFFSLSACWGGLITLASYNRFHNNVLRDTLIVCLGNCGTSIFAGFVIFSFLGFMAGELGTTVEKVATSGAGLAFIVYPEALARMEVAPLWAVLFFFMLLTLGLDSQFALMETVLTSILDLIPSCRPKKTFVMLGLCFTMFILGLTMTTNGGVYWLQLLDHYAGGWGILLIGLTESLAVAWIYGVSRFFNDISIMVGRKPRFWWKLCWMLFTPGLIIFILLFSWIDFSPVSYGGKAYPKWADTLGWCISLVSVIWIPIVAVYKLVKPGGGDKGIKILERDCLSMLRSSLVQPYQRVAYFQRLVRLFKPSGDWGPALVKHRRLVDYAPNFVLDPSAPAVDNPAFGYRGNYGFNISQPGDVHMGDSGSSAYPSTTASGRGTPLGTGTPIGGSMQLYPNYSLNGSMHSMASVTSVASYESSV